MRRILRAIFSGKALAIIGVVGIGLVVLFVAFHVIEYWRGRLSWRAYRVAAETRGVKLGIDALQTPPIPDADNFAAIPLFDEIFAAIAADMPVPEPVRIPNYSQSRQVEYVRTPRSAAGWRDAFQREGLLKDTSGDPARSVLRVLEPYEPILTQLKEAAKRPKCRFPIQWERGFAAEKSHLGVLQKAAALFSIRCCAHLELGDREAAAEDILTTLRISQLIEREPSMVNGVVRITILAIIEEALWNGIAHQQWTTGDLQRFELAWGRLRFLDDYRFILESERALMNVTLDPIMEKGNWLKTPSLGGPQNNAGGWGVVSLFPSGWGWQNQRLINELIDAKLARFDQPWPPWAERDPAVERMNALLHSRPQRFYYLLAVIAVPVLFDWEKSFLRSHALALHAQIACKLERYRQAHDAYPESLDALVPEFVAALPIDIMDGKPLRYRRAGTGGYELWSIGENRVDDNAALDPKKHWGRQADWVWRP